jgi:hypothetical protein
LNHLVKDRIEQFSQELNIASFKSANLENAVDKCLKIAQNLSLDWIAEKIRNKHRLKYLLFPDRSIIDGQIVPPLVVI